MQPEKLDKTLKKLLKDESLDGDTEIPVIITLDNSEDPTEWLVQYGFQPKHQYQNISAVAGTLPLKNIGPLSELDHIKKIEFDGEVSFFI